ncbi:MAG TPA: hypothetical protein VMZ91_11115, partial [Candidatus Paceibacterota bacterium]|nr:hypothetical protein [Candidatus Paceibacterota bacterium]
MKKYICIKCGSLVYWNDNGEYFYCSLAARSEGWDCSVTPWGPVNSNDPFIWIAKKQNRAVL